MPSISNSNLEPNITWYIAMWSNSTDVALRCHQTLADAQADTNTIATGVAGIGTDVPLTLNQTPGAPITISKYDNEIPWHLLMVAGQWEDTVIMKMGPWSDMEQVKHAIYQNREIIPYRAAALINKGTKLDTQIDISYAGTIYNLEPNNVVRINSTFMSKDIYTIAREISIELTPDAMLMSVSLSKFDQITR
jgi:hypothetical protein